jgi:hypothetical protein
MNPAAAQQYTTEDFLESQSPAVDVLDTFTKG